MRAVTRTGVIHVLFITIAIASSSLLCCCVCLGPCFPERFDFSSVDSSKIHGENAGLVAKPGGEASRKERKARSHCNGRCPDLFWAPSLESRLRTVSISALRPPWHVFPPRRESMRVLEVPRTRFDVYSGHLMC